MSKEKKKSTKLKTASAEAGQVSPASPVEKATKKTLKKTSSKPPGKSPKTPKSEKPKKSDQPAEALPVKAVTARKRSTQKSAAPKPPVVISHEDIALRAYFIAERRNFFGAPGDPASDWIEAERQLRAEAQ
ncbi:MAG: hypothetical protein Fur0032_24820 [Terrimicrobiaceae bacterium]